VSALLLGELNALFEQSYSDEQEGEGEYALSASGIRLQTPYQIATLAR